MCYIGAYQCSDYTHDTRLRFVWIHVHNLRKEAKLAATVDKGTSYCDSRTPIKAADASFLDRFPDAVSDAFELPLASLIQPSKVPYEASHSLLRGPIGPYMAL